jgi:catechol 2,3-dioxygenase-like lactoylglutathione lyase family enzyme
MTRLISHVHSVSVVVADQDAALDFYINTLGWSPALNVPMGETDRFITVALPGAVTQLALVPQSWFPDTAHAPGKVGIALITTDIEAAYETMAARGVKFKDPISLMPWGSKATWFYDPDGNEFFLTEEQSTAA